jgi:electron transfer flavoprotein alpha subunit
VSADGAADGPPPLHVAALVKQIPVFEELRLGADRRLERAGLPREMSAYDRRAVAQGVELARATGGSCTVVTLGPPEAVDVLREALAFGADRGVHVTDPAFAGSDTLATARALATALSRLEARGGPFHLVLVGRNSVDAETGQVGPQVAQLLDRPFATGVKRLAVRGGPTAGLVADVGLEHDDTWVEATVALPAVLSTAERLIDPCKVKDEARWAAVDPARVTTLTAADLDADRCADGGAWAWGQAGSPTRVGEVRAEAVERGGLRLDGTVEDQVAEAVRVLADRGALQGGEDPHELPDDVPRPGPGGGPAVVVVVEPERWRPTRELLSEAARLARRGPAGARVVAFGIEGAAGDDEVLASWGADELVVVRAGGGGAVVEEDVAAALVGWAGTAPPWAVLVGSTAWGREVAGRAAAALGAGLTGDAVGLGVEHAGGDGRARLVAWKPAFGGGLVAAVRSRSAVQMATVRAGVMATNQPRFPGLIPTSVVEVVPRGRVRVHDRRREDDVDALLRAEVVVGVGQGVDPDGYAELDPLLDVLGARLGATRKVTDRGWLPHARQIGITGHSIAPRLYVALGTSGRFNHFVGVRSAGSILAVNPDPDAPLFAVSDVGIVGDWREVVPALVAHLRGHAHAGRSPAGTERRRPG